MIEYVLKTVCSWFGYNIIPAVTPYQAVDKCTKDEYDFDNRCDCIECMPW